MMHRRLGPEKFPLIDQTYTVGRGQLSGAATNYPIIIKAGYANGGIGKVRIFLRLASWTIEQAFNVFLICKLASSFIEYYAFCFLNNTM